MRKSRIGLATAGLLAVTGLTLAGCATADEPAATDSGSTDSSDSATTGGETYEVYALLPQGNDQPYGTTYLPPMEAKAAELGIQPDHHQL
jgi:ribose transport system substrate-binding protein